MLGLSREPPRDPAPERLPTPPPSDMFRQLTMHGAPAANGTMTALDTSSDVVAFPGRPTVQLTQTVIDFKVKQ